MSYNLFEFVDAPRLRTVRVDRLQATSSYAINIDGEDVKYDISAEVTLNVLAHIFAGSDPWVKK